MKIQLHDHYDSMYVYHEIECWKKFRVRDLYCVAFSMINEFGVQKYFSFKKEYSLESKENWGSYMKSKSFIRGKV